MGALPPEGGVGATILEKKNTHRAHMVLTKNVGEKKGALSGILLSRSPPPYVATKGYFPPKILDLRIPRERGFKGANGYSQILSPKL